MAQTSTTAKAFVALVLTLGTATGVLAAVTWTSPALGPLVLFLVFSLASSVLKVVLPGVEGNLSLNYVFLLWGIAHLGLGETILVGIASTLLQCYWQCEKKPRTVQVAFNLALITLSIGVGKLVYAAPYTHQLVPGEAIRTLLASIAYFLVNTGCVATIIGLMEARPVWSVWRSSYLWTIPHYLVGGTIVVAIEALRSAFGMEVVLLVSPATYLVYRTLRMHIAGLKQAVERAGIEKQHAEATAKLHLRMIRALAIAIEAKDQTTAEHLHRVQTYAVELGKDFGLRQEEMDALRAAAILHDVGKIAVPEHIISKPARLTPEEFGKMKTHTVVGAEIVERVQFPYPVAPLVRAHHEKWDGTGYPDGLKEDEIPLGARILTAVDCLDALASDRQYRRAMPLDQAMAVVRAESGKSFDPQVVKALDRRYRELEQLARETLDGVELEFSTDLNVERGLAPDAGFASGWNGPGSPPDMSVTAAALEMPLIAEIHAEINRLNPLEHTLSAIEVPLRKLIPFDCLALYQKQGAVLRCVYSKGNSAEFLSELTIAQGVGVSGWVAANGKPLLNGNAVTEFGFSGAVPPGFDLQAGLAVALDSELGPAAVITLYSRETDAFSMNHLRVLLAIQSLLAYSLRLLGLTSASPQIEPDSLVTAQLVQLSECLRPESSSGLISYFKAV